MADYSRFPARVKFSDGRLLKKAAVVVNGSRLQIAEVAGAQLVVVEDRTDVLSLEPQPDRTMVVKLADGSERQVGKGAGCSCGSPLKTWYSQALRAATP